MLYDQSLSRNRRLAKIVNKHDEKTLVFNVNNNYYHLRFYLQGEVLAMFVCLCHGITDKQIENAVREQGIGNIRELKQTMALGSSCGSCVEMTQNIINKVIIDDSLFKEVC